MAHFMRFQTSHHPHTLPRTAAQNQQARDEEAAKALQVELSKRARSPVGNDPLQSFDSSMSKDEVRARFMALVQRSKEAAFA